MLRLLPLALILIVLGAGAYLILKSPSNTPAPPYTVTILKDKVTQEENKITTDGEGVALITYSSGTTVRVGPNSVIGIENQNKITQEAGKLFVRFKKLLGAEDNFSVETSNLVATVRGTAFASIIEQDRNPKIIVTEHEVIVLDKNKNTEVPVKEGEQLEYILNTKTSRIGRQNLTPTEKSWIDANKIIDTPTPTATTIASSTPKATIRPTSTATASASPVSFLTAMPGTGYTRSTVKTEVGSFTLTCVGVNRNGVRVITDSANETDCKTDCPVLPLDQYATRNGGFAAINGMYFCPADYPACADKKNSFDTLFFNSRVHRYINSDNNVYSSIPFFGVNADGSPHFVGQSSQWGRDTGIQAGTAGNPMLVSGGNYAVADGALESRQRDIKGPRGAIVQKGDNLYMCVVSAATVPDAGKVFKTLSADNAINIDGGGSTALWINGKYIFGPGRALPTAIIFANK